MWDQLKLNYQAGDKSLDIQRNSFFEGLGKWHLKNAALQGLMDTGKHGWLLSPVSVSRLYSLLSK